MRYLIFIFIAVQFYSRGVEHYEFLGDCGSSNPEKQFFGLNYVVSNNNSSTASNSNFAFHDLCDTLASIDDFKVRSFTSTFTCISNNSNTYSFSADVEPNLVYSEYSSSNTIKEYAIEFEDKVNGNPLALEYGSLRYNSPGKFLNFMFSLDTLNSYNSDYLNDTIHYNTIFDKDSTFFIEILDNSTPQKFVGYKYKSANSSTTFEKYFVPK